VEERQSSNGRGVFLEVSSLNSISVSRKKEEEEHRKGGRETIHFEGGDLNATPGNDFANDRKGHSRLPGGA